ncbi:Uncharacterised protein [Mycobacterium tuberculosis]|uniref:Uncharacterized protein n=1 Tax=Mycobacterium tuberculosis TaxID=1773 RepID=A0A916LAE6_MYCTX|nr:Uncharacterised protein [Mycobacterium tuberculosis]COY92486.1 Uncharacterised protein [Mycobacterium tuberculosis]COZ73179.1 Uncharacterised protein [Mycobacterium tuberculosis]
MLTNPLVNGMPAKASRNIDSITPTIGERCPSPAQWDRSASSEPAEPSAPRTRPTMANAPIVLKL